MDYSFASKCLSHETLRLVKYQDKSDYVLKSFQQVRLLAGRPAG
ncbi:hypothetical protein D3OALGB2SA_4338 [Olavius algarvensis associated proteobacterium Delta 3]|nr:hypothetical protein D3OALGB2SA_4338 [Olavius algarvensis associated proteobacterium Delta 3]